MLILRPSSVVWFRMSICIDLQCESHAKFESADWVHNRLPSGVLMPINPATKQLLRAIMNFHNIKMNDINLIIKELWLNTYCGTGARSVCVCVCVVKIVEERGGGGVALCDAWRISEKIFGRKGTSASSFRCFYPRPCTAHMPCAYLCRHRHH